MQGVHVDGTFYCTREALKIMNPQMSGAIVNMASVMGTFGRPGSVPYSTAKAAILGFTRSLAHEVAPRNIRVNAIAPGWIDTDMTVPLGELKKRIAAQTPLGRIGDTDDIAWAAVYLASDEAKFMTGQVHLAQRRLVHEPVLPSAKIASRSTGTKPSWPMSYSQGRPEGDWR